MTGFDAAGLRPEMLVGALIPMALVYLRIQALLIVMPGFGERVVPARVKIALALVLTPLFASLAQPAAIDGLAALIGAALSETVLGLILGTQLRLMAAMLSIATSAIAATASLSQLVGGDNEMAPHPVGNLMQLAGLALLMAMGFPVMLASYVGTSFALWPAAGLPDVATATSLIVDLMIRGFGLAMILASPFVLGGVLYQALAGVVNKVMPSLPVVFVGAPVAILLALAALTMFSGTIINVWADAMFDLDPRDFVP